MRNFTPDDLDFLSVNDIYRIASEEMEEGSENYGIATRAIAESHGDKEMAKSLFIKFQYEELAKQEAFEREEREKYQRKEHELADKRWQRQMELERKEIELAEKWRQLKRQRKLEFNCIERKFEEMERRGVAIGLMVAVIIGVVWFSVYEDKSLANFISSRDAPYVTAAVNTADSAKVTQYLKAAEQGNIKTQIDLGMAYENGKGIAKDEVQAAFWFRKAADQGDALAQDILGYLYANGKGVVTDKAQAVIWYRKAAEQGNINAQFNLAMAYKNGIGLPKDEAQAVKWFGKAALQNDAEAQTILGKIYEQGLFGIKKNELQAEAWYEKAAEQGNQDASEALVNLEAWLKD